MIKKENIILHACTKDEWRKAVTQGFFETPSLKSQGFIHCSEIDTILRVANSNWNGRKDLILLVIDTNKIAPLVKFEPDPESGTLYPHIYGPLNTDAVIEIKEFLPNQRGIFDESSIA